MTEDDAAYVVTAQVGVRLDRLERMHSNSLYTLADCTVSIGDVEVTLHGVRILREPSGKLRAGSPLHKSRDGSWRPAIGMPKRILNAIIELVVDELDEARDPRLAPGKGL